MITWYIYMKETDVREIIKIVDNLKTNISAGSDDIKVKVIKNLKKC